MPKGKVPSVFVSSTCFDLKQVRADLRQFLQSLGLDPVLSDFDSFPIDPSRDTVTNCIEALRNRADILVLIVGGRYGSTVDIGKSITNLEYIEAKAKGIPIYIFVSNNIINILPVWKKNKEADFSEVVDNNKLFEFVELLRDTRDNWIFTFDSAQNICETLRQQLAYLFMDCLCLRSMLTEDILGDRELSQIHPKSLRILIDKPRGWEHLFFIQLVQNYIDDFEKIRKDLQYGITFGKRVVLTDLPTITQWISQQISRIDNSIKGSVRLLNEGLPIAFGEPGEPGDPKHIQYIAKRFAEGYKELIEWRLEFLRTDVDDQFVKLLDLLSKIATNAIREIEDYIKYINGEVNKIIENIDHYEAGTTINLTLILTIPDTNELFKEFERVKQLYGVP